MVTAWQRVKGRLAAREKVRKSMDEGPTLEDKKIRGGVGRGRKRSRNGKNVFSIRSIWCCIPLEIS